MAEIYTINSLSLREHILINEISDAIYFSLGKYNGDTKLYEIIEGYESASIPENGEEIINLDTDGIYKFKISINSSLSESSIVILNNNTTMIEAQQKFISELLARGDCRECNTLSNNQYYDFITFSILIKTYEDLIRIFHISPNQSDESLTYQIWYIQEQIKKYY